MYISITGQKNNMLDDQDHFNVLREIDKSTKPTQRQHADKLGFSLGKLNYCIKALKKKGLVKISNFEKNPNKLKYIYILTPRGISQKTRLTINFMKTKMKEYENLKKELTIMSRYDESSIKSLNWRQHIRLRPGMYVGKLGNGKNISLTYECD